MITNLLLTGVGGFAQTSVLVATPLVATASLTLVVVCLGVCIHTRHLVEHEPARPSCATEGRPDLGLIPCGPTGARASSR